MLFFICSHAHNVPTSTALKECLSLSLSVCLSVSLTHTHTHTHTPNKSNTGVGKLGILQGDGISGETCALFHKIFVKNRSGMNLRDRLGQSGKNRIGQMLRAKKKHDDW